MLLHANSYLKDKRIPPDGCTLSQADVIEPQTKPAGVAADADFNFENGVEGSGSDTVHYRVALTNPADSHSVSVRLLYQPIQPAFIDSLHATGSQVTAFKQMVAVSPPGAELLVTANAIITAAGTGSGGGVVVPWAMTDVLIRCFPPCCWSPPRGSAGSAGSPGRIAGLNNPPHQ